jgi:hypothetical protein
LSGEKPKRFALAPDRTSFAPADLGKAEDFRTIKSKQEKIRDQDNAKPVPKPQIFSLDNPRLAPPGMKGINRSVKPGQDVNINISVNVRVEPERAPPRSFRANDVPKEKLRLGDQDKARKEFKPIARSFGNKPRLER